MAISIDEVRRRTLIALFSDDELMDALVLKGGNALALVHHVGSRASVDMDFSIRAAFGDVKKTGDRIFGSLRREFEAAGYVIFDEKFEIRPGKPSKDQPDWWGGYVAEFKLASKALYDRLGHDLDGLRRQSEVLGPGHMRRYTIDISRHEFCEGKVKREIDDYSVYVYSLEMIAAEKLRAICQQMNEYPYGNKSPRARDFYDIHEIVAGHGIDLTKKENLAVIAAVFEAKKVPMELLAAMNDYRDFHAPDWPAVEASVEGKPKDYGYYFNFAVELALGVLKASRKK
jgi:hypothetical protein